jgi:hypothetical protein
VALLYGISKYDNSSFASDLLWPAADAVAMKPLLDQSNGGLFSQVYLRTDSSATKTQLKNDIASAAAILGPDDEFLFYYSGHGTQGYTGASDGHARIVPYGDASSGTPVYSVSTMVSEDELRDMLATLPTKKVVLIIDACFSGGFIKGIGTDGVPQAAYDYYVALWKAFLAGKAPDASTSLTSWYTEVSSQQTSALASWTKAVGNGSGFASDQAQILSAAGALEESYDDPAVGTDGSHNWLHGAFTHFLLEAKAHGDLDGNGYVTVSEAYRYAFDGLQNEWNGVWGAVGAGSFAAGNALFPHLSQGPTDFLLFKR